MENQLLAAVPEPQTCPAFGFQKLSVCVPVTVTPFAKPGATETKCCGDPVVKPGDSTCTGRKNGACNFTITQEICVKVPVEFGADVNVGDTFVECKDVSDKDICRSCGVKDVYK